MSAVQEPTTNAMPETTHASSNHVGTDGPIGEATTTPNEAYEDAQPEITPVEKKDETTAVPAVESKADKAVEPVSEGLLGYKAPGLLKSLTFSKKDFWLSDDAVTPQHMDLYMRGEKSEISNPVVAWASQTGKGLLFFVKKNETSKTHPAGVLALYDAEDLEKQSPHEFSFKLHGHKHQFKAANDAERDGWYLSIEKAIELGKASKESTRASEGYKAEMEKLNTPNTMTGAAAAVGTKRSQSQPKKSTEINKAESAARRTGSSSSSSVEEKQKKPKSRSTSRGMLNKLKGKKDEMEVKREEKKEEKELEKEEKKADKMADKHIETGAAGGVTAPVVLAGGSAFDAHGTADRALDAPIEEQAQPTTESGAAKPTDAPASETPKAKRGSIFGRMQSGFSSIKSPSKEKSATDAELKPEVPPKDAGVSETAPQIPEPSTATEPTETATAPAITEPKSETTPAVAKEEVTTPNKEKKSFLGGLGGLMGGKRDRSVSPSAAMKDARKTTEAPAVPAKDETTEPLPENAATTMDPSPAEATNKSATEKPMEKAVEPMTNGETSSPTTNKRQSIVGTFSGLGRRASKAFGSKPRKESTAPVVNQPKETTTEATPAAPTETRTEEPAREQHSIGDVVPEAITTGEQQRSNPTVSATA